MKINIIFAFENTCNVLYNSIIRNWKIMRYTRFIILMFGNNKTNKSISNQKINVLLYLTKY